jgi:hypothetical protein
MRNFLSIKSADTVFLHNVPRHAFDITDNNCIIVDIDGTLADTRHRQHYLEGKKKDWPGFFAACAADALYTEIRALTNAMYATSDVFLCTGRPSNYFEATHNWLRDNGIKYDCMLMRKEGDTRPDTVVKKEMLDLIRAHKWNILFSVDDRPEVVEMWRANGVPCLSVDPVTWKKVPREHDLYKTGDPDAPEQIKDRNGVVVLNCCRVCGKAEVELVDGEPCEGK